MGCDSQFKDSVKLFIEQIDVIKRLAAAYPDDLTFVTDAKGIIAFHNAVLYIFIILYPFFAKITILKWHILRSGNSYSGKETWKYDRS